MGQGLFVGVDGAGDIEGGGEGVVLEEEGVDEGFAGFFGIAGGGGVGGAGGEARRARAAERAAVWAAAV